MALRRSPLQAPRREPAPQTRAADTPEDTSVRGFGGSASTLPACEPAIPAVPLPAAAAGPLPVETRAEMRYAAVPPPVKPGKPASESLRQEETVDSTITEKGTAKVAETMRVDTDRLDSLMNLAGELVVNRARLVQVSRQISPALRKASMLDRIREFRDGLGRTVEKLQSGSGDVGDLAALTQQLRAGMELMDEQAAIWDNGRYCFGQITEAIDQLSRVSHSLQRAVLDTRMVPVGPLFHRFKRVVRDLSKECGKTVTLVVRGEKTELDKRMIDELGDPLVHLVRNSIDHGLEPPDVRIARGKPEVGTISLEASHRGNNVFIRVQDDGGGIDVARIKAKLVDRQILSASAVAELSDAQALDYIWHPGFSTAREVTDISGRGVGMDVVKTRISVLNGTVAVETTPLQGTSFTLRLPLTLAIINALLVRVEDTVFSMPIDDVREIVSVKVQEIITVHGKQTFEVRGEFVPLVSVHEVFHGCSINSVPNGVVGTGHVTCGGGAFEAVILHAGGKTLGLRVDELLGCQDVVIKSLAENFINIRGLSGASILEMAACASCSTSVRYSTWRPGRHEQRKSRTRDHDGSGQPFVAPQTFGRVEAIVSRRLRRCFHSSRPVDRQTLPGRDRLARTASTRRSDRAAGGGRRADLLLFHGSPRVAVRRDDSGLRRRQRTGFGRYVARSAAGNDEGLDRDGDIRRAGNDKHPLLRLLELFVRKLPQCGHARTNCCRIRRGLPATSPKA